MAHHQSCIGVLITRENGSYRRVVVLTHAVN
jgi:hypothetical protein